MHQLYTIISFALFILIPLCSNSQCYTNNNVQASSTDVDCDDNNASLVIKLESGSGTGNACLIISYTEVGGQTINQEFTNLSGPTDVTINNIDCNSSITLTPKTAPNCNGTNCADPIVYSTVSQFISSTLPVELLHFKAEIKDKEQIIIKWSTANEIDNDYFIIQRKSDNAEWEEIGKIPGSGNSNTIKKYEFVDRNPLKPISYYRIVDVDFAGIRSYSKEISLDTRGQLNDIQISPNPAKDGFLIFGLTKESNVNIHSLDGKLIKSQKAMSDEIYISVGDINKGIYIISIRDRQFTMSEKLIIN